MDVDSLAVGRETPSLDQSAPPTDTFAQYLPPGWMTLRVAHDRWLLYGPHRDRGPSRGSAVLVGELTWLHSDEWRVLPVDEILPWDRTFPNVLAALDPLMTWWNLRRRYRYREAG
ncbi:hypothetical protein [Cryptosporangium arvum]|uniref:hypothetical protein n=1 Tax=Cryptosporangium arvum TaxID=80871 RepID=UPI0004B6D8FC|nr:hypothetical protein [Cryptosporangium arvum]